MRDIGIGTVVNEFINKGWRRVDKGIKRAREVVDEGLDKARRAKETIENAVKRALDYTRE